jgi:hypothetical protein
MYSKPGVSLNHTKTVKFSPVGDSNPGVSNWNAWLKINDRLELNKLNDL